ncbi:hypothetical protein N7456_007464 [Penicillium angulare]|uniref:NAD(P)-binding protein n=1 Tax=Penicillium angulare TaxID=116970 RepID=A0A9W9FAS7_9EURO|nr:hypothetical protein N7456_007464 [Penicillium angulare]
MELPDLTLGLDGTHVLITGAAGHIGSGCVAAFLSAGARVTALDLTEAKLQILGSHDNLLKVTGDITDSSQLESAFETAYATFGTIACCIALASLDLDVLNHGESILDLKTEDLQRTLKVNVEGTFLTCRTWLQHIKDRAQPNTKNVSLVIVGSESGHFGERINPDYAAGKSAVQFGLLRSLAADVPRIFPRGRVNVIAPGPVDTALFQRLCREDPDLLYREAGATSAGARPIPVSDVAKGVLFLASENWSGSVIGQVLNVDGGKQGKLLWTQEELQQQK